MGITRFPIWCGDNLLMELYPDADAFTPPRLEDPGLKVLNFHPVHIWCNSRSMAETRALLAGRSLPTLTEEEARPLRRAGKGMEKVFDHALRILTEREHVHTLKELL